MSWKIRLLPERPEKPEVGDAWLCPDILKNDQERPLLVGSGNESATRLSPQYYSVNGLVRPPLVVFMPGNRPFCVDHVFSSGERGWHGSGWKVSGDPENLTLQPSVNLVGTYHGYITDGVIGDEVEGRKYDKEGNLL